MRIIIWEESVLLFTVSLLSDLTQNLAIGKETEDVWDTKFYGLEYDA